jgi:hypothetical protein
LQIKSEREIVLLHNIIACLLIDEITYLKMKLYMMQSFREEFMSASSIWNRGIIN